MTLMKGFSINGKETESITIMRSNMEYKESAARNSMLMLKRRHYCYLRDACSGTIRQLMGLTKNGMVLSL